MTEEKGIGHNSNQAEELQKFIVEYAKCDEESQELNDRRSEIRHKVKDMGIDPKAFVAEVNRSKQNLKKREGYDEDCQTVRGVIGDMDMKELWSHVFERAEKRNAEREAKKKAKESAKEESENNAVIDKIKEC